MIKKYRSPDYNYDFDMSNGFMVRWGKTLDDDPDFSPVGPEILDIEVSTICHKGCRECYKRNTFTGKYMSFETFKKIIDKVKGNISQAALGIGSVDGVPDLEKMFKYCRDNDIVPNITINGDRMDKYYYDIIAKYCGACSVSNYGWENCLAVVTELKKRGLQQVNVHQILSLESYEECLRIIDSYTSEMPFNALVFLSLKQKGRGENLHPINQEQYNHLMQKALDNGIPIGSDSCGCSKLYKYIDTLQGKTVRTRMRMLCEPCESGKFSAYISVDAKYYPCSFAEGIDGFEGINVLEVNDFLKDVWFSESVTKWRNNLIERNHNDNYSCPIYTV